MKILVTGASGMLGTPLAARLSKNHEVLSVSKSGRKKTIPLDLTKKDDVLSFFSRERIHLVFHTAAYSEVDGCERDPQLAHASNSLATLTLSQLCGQKNIALVHVSTDYVFDGDKESPYEVDDPRLPVNVYGLTKLAAEYHVAHYAPFSAIVRTSWLFGPDSPLSFVNAILKRLRSDKKVRILDDQIDSPTFVEDLAAALENIGNKVIAELTAGTKKSFQPVFHVCNSGSTTRLQMTHKIKEILGLEEAVVERLDKNEIQNRPAVRPRKTVMSTRAYEKCFGVKLRPWESSLEEFLKREELCAS